MLLEQKMSYDFQEVFSQIETTQTYLKYENLQQNILSGQN